MEMCDPASVNPNPEEQSTLAVPAEASAESLDSNPVNINDAEDGAAEGLESGAEESGEKLTRDDVIAAAKALLEKDPAEITTDDIRRLRMQHARVHISQQPAGEESEEKVAVEDEEFDSLIAAVREKKNAYAAKVEAEQLANLERKNEIIAEIDALAEDTDNVNRTFPRYRELQDEFNAIGDVPPSEDTAIWKRFQEAREKYSDNLKINKELRDYDFKKNLESKMLLLDEAVELTLEDDIILAYRRLQELHNKWKRIGPVAKEVRQEIWDKFKAASTEINKRYQAHFEARKAREAENEAGKTALCEDLEALDLSALRSFSAWDEATKQVIAIQEKWRTFGFASKKMNKALFARFRELCDKFFAAKADYFHSTREELANNLARKTALVERAEALKDSTDWKTATDEFVALQKEWKTIGSVAKKYSDAIWQRFQTACDYFFEQKKKANSGTRKIEMENLKAKREIIAALEQITEETPREEAIAALKELQDKWKGIGHVPFREKDKLYEAYRARIDALRDSLNLRRNRERIERFNDSISSIEGDESKLYREREKLLRALDARRQELRTYENNLGFLSSKSKSGDSMLREFERKAERLRLDIADLQEKVKLIDSKLS